MSPPPMEFAGPCYGNSDPTLPGLFEPLYYQGHSLLLNRNANQRVYIISPLRPIAESSPNPHNLYT